jgi:hypothetical protein
MTNRFKQHRLANCMLLALHEESLDEHQRTDHQRFQGSHPIPLSYVLRSLSERLFSGLDQESFEHFHVETIGEAFQAIRLARVADELEMQGQWQGVPAKHYQASPARPDVAGFVVQRHEVW